MNRTLQILSLTIAASSTLSAGLVEIGFTATPLTFDLVAKWDFTTPVTLSLADSAAWSAELSEAAFAGGRTVKLNWAHVRTPAAPPHGEPRNPLLGTFQISTVNLIPPGPLQSASAMQRSHGKHFDVVRLTGSLPAAGLGEVKADGLHFSDQLASWSYEAGSDGTIRVKSGGVTLVKEQKVVAGEKLNDADKQKLKEKATDYTVIFAGSGIALPDKDPVTSTTLAFLGDVDGANGQLDLAAAIALFMGNSTSFFAPMFLDTLGERDLFVGIDLVQWLSFGMPFAPGLFADFVNGMSEEYPGVIVGFSPVVYDQISGQFTTDDPATGSFEIVGSIDGSTTAPEPSNWALTALGLAAAMALRQWRSRIRRPATLAP
ncbi:MAG: hypothetical protein ABI972_12440 [Acidobacteriota bacterium]